MQTSTSTEEVATFRFKLTDEQKRIVGTVREVTQGEFKPRGFWISMDGTFPWENMRSLAEIGVLGMAVPQEYGGSRSACSTPRSCSRNRQGLLRDGHGGAG